MGRSSARKDVPKFKPISQTLPSSPTHSSSSSDFEFTVSLSPRKSTTSLIPADELFYKGQLLPLHLSPRLSMVRTLLLSSSSTSSSDTTTTASRDSTGSSSTSSSDHLLLLPDSRDSSRRPSSVTEDDSHTFTRPLDFNFTTSNNHLPPHAKKPKYFSLPRFSFVFRKEPKLNNNNQPDHANIVSGSSVKRVSSTAKDVIRKYLKKMKPLYEKLSQKQGTNTPSKASTMLMTTNSSQIGCAKDNTTNSRSKDNNGGTISHSFSGNLRYPRRKSCVSSCPSSMRSSPSHSGVLSRNGVTLMSKQFGMGISGGSSSSYSSESSSMEELQSAIQGAIAHCKNSMNIQTTDNNNNNYKSSTTMVSNEV